MSQTQAIKEALIALATIAGKELTEIALNAFMKALSDLDQDAVIVALEGWLRTGKGFPYPADIREKISPELTGDDDAQYVSNMIINAVGKDGYTNQERAKGRIGELGWAVVEASGGWKHLCETLNQANETTVKAQLRELCKTVYKRAKSGYLDQKPALPSPTGVTKLIQQTMKGIE
jgi:hypothetical protein